MVNSRSHDQSVIKLMDTHIQDSNLQPTARDMSVLPLTRYAVEIIC